MSDTPRPSPITAPTFIKAMGALLALFNLGLVASAVWVLLLSRRHYVERAESATQNLAQVMENNVEDTIRGIDLAIQALQDEGEHDLRNPRLGSLVRLQFKRAGILDSLQVADATGRVLHAAPAPTARSVADWDFFRHLQASPAPDLFISRPARSPDGTWDLILARRIERAGGGFAGVVFALLPTEQLARTMSQVNVGRWGSVSLRGVDLSLLARYPDFTGQQQMTGDTHITGAYLQAVQANRPSMQFTENSVLDGLRRTYSLRRTDHPPFYILVGLAQREYLQVWRHQVAFAIAAVLALALLTLALGWQARASWIRQLTDQERVAAQEARYRLLAENATDLIWSMDPDGRLTYVSPSILRQRGWTPEEFMTLNPESRALSRKGSETFRERMVKARQLPPGSQPFEQDLLQSSVKCKDGREIQVEAQWRIVWGEDGRLLGFQGVTRDITERRRLEVERERLIQNLTQALADVKQLSGMLPICSNCKKVRDDHGYWSQIETYLSEHTEATFTHGVCPECAQAFREDIQARRTQKSEGEGL
ncbi:PAS domain S-box protein [Geothrix oryzisoli]|uniref:PAS domain S-box protein n=1 Tax=Geothrix oryzisoli TaxID=2922721 RepID=UPI001FAE562D|nr:PAS domain S-box protein [Geothrix oryzisoli]